MDIYLVILICSALFIISGFLLPRVPQNSIFGLRTTATLSDEEIWRLSNRRASYFLYFFGFISLLLDLFFWFSEFPEQIFGNYLLISLVILVVLITVYLIIYSNNLWKKKNKGAKITSKVVLPRYFIYIIEVGVAFLIVAGILMLFVSPNGWIGIRIPKSFSNLLLWQKVNRISGIGFVLLGAVFAILFFKDSSMEDQDRTKNFEKHFLWFTIFIILWSLASVAIAYLPV